MNHWKSERSGPVPALFSGHRIIFDGAQSFDFLVTSDGNVVSMSCERFLRMDMAALAIFQDWVKDEASAFANAQLAELEEEDDQREQTTRREQRMPRDPQGGFIYIVRAVGILSDAGRPLYKIGLAKSTEGRLAHLGVVMPFKLELVHAIPTNDVTKAEKRLHNQFAIARKGGEWFELSDSDIVQIMTLNRIDEKETP